MTIKNKEEIKELITRCKIYRLTPQETLSFLEDNGHKISERSLRRIKSDMESNISNRLNEMTQHDNVAELFHSLDTHREIEKEYWKLIPQATTINEKIKIYDAIHKNRDKIEMLTAAPPLWKQLFETLKPLRQKANEIQQNC